MSVLIDIKGHPITESDLTAVLKQLYDALEKYGIKDSITVKVKHFDKPWVALYRSRSQFGRKPIFWLNDKPDIYNECISADLEAVGHVVTSPRLMILTSLAHEYGHVIAEMAWIENSKLYQEIMATWCDEESFAESGVMRYLVDGYCNHESKMEEIIRWYKRQLE